MGPFTIPELQATPTILTEATLPRGDGRTLLLVVAHADDGAIFAGGVLALWARAGWRIHALRVTDDRWDSVGLDEVETIRRNAAEFRQAADILRIAETQDLMWQTDVLGNADRVVLRERIIRAIRTVRPYALMSFDPNALFYEDNLDHKVLAEAVDEAYWTAMFDKHHPEHFAAGLAPHGCVERWYFGRTLASVTHVVDTSTVIETQLLAVKCHATPIANMAHQFALQARTAGWDEDRIRAAVVDPGAAIAERVRSGAKNKGKPFGLSAAEYLRGHAVDLRT
jgi:LmbE family N-acetylglucosaminyl deacetylase